MPEKKVNTPYHISISALLTPPREAPSADRRAWSIPIAGVWVPFFTAANATGEANLPAEVLGAPLRLAKDEDGTPKFSRSGRPVLRVVKELSDQVRFIRENFVASLEGYKKRVLQAMPEAYKAQVEANLAAGKPIIEADAQSLRVYIEAVKAAQDGEATPQTVEAQLVAA